MKSNIDKFQPKSVGWLNGLQFLKSGVTGAVTEGCCWAIVGKKKSRVDDMDWVESEEYRSKIESLLVDERKMSIEMSFLV